MAEFLIHTGDCLEVMRGMADASIDSCVTDPPYGLSFMNKHWDYEIPSVEIFREIYRLLKNGSRLLCFGGTRTMHRIWCNIEDAGFTIEDSIMWVYGSGFPKHKSKLKPAYEPICVARKGSVSALNIDDCRIEAQDGVPLFGNGRRTAKTAYSDGLGCDGRTGEISHKGRWPTNIILDSEAAAALDQQSGNLTSGTGAIRNVTGTGYRPNAYGAESRPAGTPCVEYGDSGGASRFFYCAKADRAERNAGLEGMPKRKASSMPGRRNPDDMSECKIDNDVTERFVTEKQNHHPTVKPVDLMQYLCRLVTPENGQVLDPFCGSGSTGIAALREGFNFIGIEREAEYVEIARRRILNDAPLLNIEKVA